MRDKRSQLRDRLSHLICLKKWRIVIVIALTEQNPWKTDQKRRFFLARPLHY